MNSELDDFRRTVDDIAAGSPQAVSHFIETYGRHVRRVVRRRLARHMRSRFDSADFMQMVWGSFFKEPDGMQKFRTPQEVVSYLLTMARNKVVDQSRKKNPEVPEAEWNDDSMRSFGESPPGAMMDHSTPSQYAMANERLHRIMSDPSEVNRRMVQMRMQGASYAEIARRLQVGETKVRQTLQKIAGEKK